MAATRFEQVPEVREGGVDRIQQPEVGDIGRTEIRQALVLLAAQTGDSPGAPSRRKPP